MTVFNGSWEAVIGLEIHVQLQTEFEKVRTGSRRSVDVFPGRQDIRRCAIDAKRYEKIRGGIRCDAKGCWMLHLTSSTTSFQKKTTPDARGARVMLHVLQSG